MTELGNEVVRPKKELQAQGDKTDGEKSLSERVPMMDFSKLSKENAAASAALPQLTIGSTDGKPAEATKAKVIEVPPSDELDSPEWHKHEFDHQKGLPGEFISPVSTRVVPDARVAEALSKIDTANMKQRLEELSGNKEVIINGKPVTLDSRSTFGPGYELALQYFKEKFEKDGYTVTIDDYTRRGETYHNLRAMKLGTSKPDEVVMFGAHIDSTAGSPWGFEEKAPGADDDLSGSVALAEMAHAIKDLPTDRTIVFSMFSGEEEGLWGSRAMAELYKQSQNKIGDDLDKAGVDARNGKDGLGKIIGMYQMDMIGYAKNSKTIESHDTTSDQGSHDMTDRLAAAQQAYNIDLKVYGAHNEELTNRSDHYPFLKNGIPAVLVIEPYDTTDTPNPNYHSTEDTIDKMNMPYMTNVTKMVLAAGVELAGLKPVSK